MFFPYLQTVQLTFPVGSSTTDVPVSVEATRRGWRTMLGQSLIVRGSLDSCLEAAGHLVPEDRRSGVLLLPPFDGRVAA